MCCIAVVGEETRVAVSPLYYQFGSISDKEPVSYLVTIRNLSGDVLQILEIKTPCSCTVVTPHSLHFAPGEAGQLKIVFDPRGRQGYLRWEIAVRTTLEPAPIRIAFDATVLKDDFLSQRMVYFEEFERGSRPEQKIWISPQSRSLGMYGSSGCPHFVVDACYVEIEKERGYFDIHLGLDRYEHFYPGPRPAFCIHIIPKADIPFGRIQGKLRIVTDIPGLSEIEVPLIARVVGEIGLSRDYVAMGIIAEDTPVTRKIMVYNRKGNAFQIRDVQSSLPFLKTRVENVVPDQYYEIQVTGKADATMSPGEFRGQLVIGTSCREQPQIVLPVQGFIQPKKPQ